MKSTSVSLRRPLEPSTIPYAKPKLGDDYSSGLLERRAPDGLALVTEWISLDESAQLLVDTDDLPPIWLSHANRAS